MLGQAMVNHGRTSHPASLLLLLSLLLSLGPSTARCPAAGGEEGQCYALLVGGLSGTEVHARRHLDWLVRFRRHLTEVARVPEANIIVLSGDEGVEAPSVRGGASAETVKEALKQLAQKAKPEDQLVLFLVGHGVLTEKVPTLVLPGPDLDAQELSTALKEVKAGNVLILNFSASSGAFLRQLVKSGRVNLAATSPIEGNEPVFAEFFLRGLESKRADGEGAPTAGARDGVVTVLEAYNWATHQTALWIMRIRAVGKAWRVNGKESVEIFEKLYGGPEGAPGMRKLSPASDRNAPDGVVSIKPKDGIVDGSWEGRRVLSEHSLLEDCGEENGVSAIRAEGYEPLAGKQKGEPGHLARRMVIGRAGLLPIEEGR